MAVILRWACRCEELLQIVTTQSNVVEKKSIRKNVCLSVTCDVALWKIATSLFPYLVLASTPPGARLCGHNCPSLVKLDSFNILHPFSEVYHLSEEATVFRNHQFEFIHTFTGSLKGPNSREVIFVLTCFERTLALCCHTLLKYMYWLRGLLKTNSVAQWKHVIAKLLWLELRNTVIELLREQSCFQLFGRTADTTVLLYIEA